MDMRKFIAEAAQKQQAERTRVKPLVEMWQQTNLLKDLNDSDAFTVAQLLQNQTNRLMHEASRTSTAAGGEEWNDIALPIVRKVFVEGNAKKLIHTQATDKPSGVFFYLDFQLNDNKPSADNFYTANESVYGTTDASDVSGGFYGADRYSYSMNYYSASVDMTNATTSGSATWSDVEFLDGLSASVAAGEMFKVVIPTSSISTDIDALAPETHVLGHGNIVNLYRRFTKISGGSATFIYSGSVIGAGESVNIRYTQQPKYYDRGDFESGQTGVGLPTELNIKVTQKLVVAKTRWLKTEMTPELIQDLKAYQTLDAQKEVVNIMSQFLAQEEDLEILSMLSDAADVNKRYWSAQVGTYLNGSTGAVDADQATWTMGPNDWYRTLGIRMNELAFDIQKRTLRGRANWAVVSPKVAALIQSMELFRSNEQSNGTMSIGLENVGTLNGMFNIYSNPYWRDEEILMGFKGNNFLESGAGYLQYIPYMMTPPITSYQDASVHQFLQTRNAKVVIRSEFYGKVIIKNMNSF